MSTIYFGSAVGQNMNSTDNYNEAKAAGNMEKAAFYKGEMQATGPDVAAGMFGIAASKILYEVFVISKSTKTITRSNIRTVKGHLNKYFKGDPGNEIMLDRLKQIRKGKLKATQVDINFVKHELRESQLMKKGKMYEEAHNQTLNEQGMGNRIKYHEQLYTKEALEAQGAAEAAKYGIKR